MILYRGLNVAYHMSLLPQKNKKMQTRGVLGDTGTAIAIFVLRPSPWCFPSALLAVQRSHTKPLLAFSRKWTVPLQGNGQQTYYTEAIKCSCSWTTVWRKRSSHARWMPSHLPHVLMVIQNVQSVGNLCCCCCWPLNFIIGKILSRTGIIIC